MNYKKNELELQTLFAKLPVFKEKYNQHWETAKERYLGNYFQAAQAPESLTTSLHNKLKDLSVKYENFDFDEILNQLSEILCRYYEGYNKALGLHLGTHHFTVLNRFLDEILTYCSTKMDMK